MKISNLGFLLGIFVPFAAIAANEGVPSYYHKTGEAQNANQANAQYYKDQGFTDYIGQSGKKTVLGTSTYSYDVPVSNVGYLPQGTMTTNGISMPVETGTDFEIGYTRRFADFQFKTGVNSILEWDDMIFNEIEVGINHDFALSDLDLFVTAGFSYGSMSHGGLSMDYDLMPYDESRPDEGSFTISVGEMSGDTTGFRVGIGANKVWDFGGWKMSPSIGYEIFQHNLEMSNHLYPNPGIYLPLLTDAGDYVYGDLEGNFYTVPQGFEPPTDLFQVCMSPEDIKVVQTNTGSGFFDLGTSLNVGDWTNGDYDWGVGAGNCVVIGGDGAIEIPGTTHIYNTTWSGLYVGLEMEKQMTLVDSLRFYVQFGLPSYYAEGIWPNRTDWQQNPSFIEEGNNGAYSYRAEMEYNYQMSERMKLSVRVDSHFFHVGEIAGELYVSEYTDFTYDDAGNIILDSNGLPILQTVPASTVEISDSLDYANWQSFGLHLGVKYAF